MSVHMIELWPHLRKQTSAHTVACVQTATTCTRHDARSCYKRTTVNPGGTGVGVSYWMGCALLDEDECSTGYHICGQECVTTIGSYDCACGEGYQQLGNINCQRWGTDFTHILHYHWLHDSCKFSGQLWEKLDIPKLLSQSQEMYTPQNCSFFIFAYLCFISESIFMSVYSNIHWHL